MQSIEHSSLSTALVISHCMAYCELTCNLYYYDRAVHISVRLRRVSTTSMGWPILYISLVQSTMARWQQLCTTGLDSCMLPRYRRWRPHGTGSITRYWNRRHMQLLICHRYQITRYILHWSRCQISILHDGRREITNESTEKRLLWSSFCRRENVSGNDSVSTCGNGIALYRNSSRRSGGTARDSDSLPTRSRGLPINRVHSSLHTSLHYNSILPSSTLLTSATL